MATLIKQKETQPTFEIGDRIIATLYNFDGRAYTHSTLYGTVTKVNRKTIECTCRQGETYRLDKDEAKNIKDLF